MRRNDTVEIGDAAEAEAARLLKNIGYNVTNLNHIRRNHQTYDLLVAKGADSFKVSVKCARAKRDIALGVPRSVRRLEPGSFMIAFLPTAMNCECSIADSNYEVWVVPSEAIQNDALQAHAAYWDGSPEKYEANTVRVKDKVDRPGGRSQAGQVFQNWAKQYKDAWRLLPGQ